MLACFQLSHCLGDGAAHDGQIFSPQWIKSKQAQTEAQRLGCSRECLTETFFQVILDCVKLTIKTIPNPQLKKQNNVLGH